MNKKKLAKLIKAIDPEPSCCFPVKCGYWKIERSNTIYDVLAERQWIDAPRNSVFDYRDHLVGCAWASWALRETVRQNITMPLMYSKR